MSDTDLGRNEDMIELAVAAAVCLKRGINGESNTLYVDDEIRNGAPPQSQEPTSATSNRHRHRRRRPLPQRRRVTEYLSCSCR
jgi:hypothetical protein